MKRQTVTISLLTVIALATSWYIKTQVINKKASALEIPQIIAEHIERSHFTPEGILAYRLKADKMQEYRKRNIVTLTKPQLRTFLPPSLWSTTADQGTITNNKQPTIELNGHVVVHRFASPTNSALTIQTTKLTVHPNRRTADTDQAVTITQDQVVTHGIGMHADLKTGIVQLKSQLHSEIVPH